MLDNSGMHLKWQDIVGNCGFQTVAAISAVAEYSIIHQYAAGRPDEKDAEELHGFAKTLFGRLVDKIIIYLLPDFI